MANPIARYSTKFNRPLFRVNPLESKFGYQRRLAKLLSGRGYYAADEVDGPERNPPFFYNHGELLAVFRNQQEPSAPAEERF